MSPGQAAVLYAEANAAFAAGLTVAVLAALFMGILLVRAVWR